MDLIILFQHLIRFGTIGNVLISPIMAVLGHLKPAKASAEDTTAAQKLTTANTTILVS